MPHKKIILLRVLFIMLLTAGIATLSRPLYRYCRWKIKEIKIGLMHDPASRATLEAVYAEHFAAWLKVPDLGLDTLVLSGASEEKLKVFPCLSDAGPGFAHPGIKVVLGHRDTHFRKLKDSREGQQLQVVLPGKKELRYEVVEREIIPADGLETRLQDGRKKNEDWLVLVTCYPFRYLGPAPKRFLLWAKRTNSQNPPGDARELAGHWGISAISPGYRYATTGFL